MGTQVSWRMATGAGLAIALACSAAGAGAWHVSELLSPDPVLSVAGHVSSQGRPVEGVYVRFHAGPGLGSVPYGLLAITNAVGHSSSGGAKLAGELPPGDYVVTFMHPSPRATAGATAS